MPLEPPGLQSDGAAGRGPEGTVRCGGVAAAWWRGRLVDIPQEGEERGDSLRGGEQECCFSLRSQIRDGQEREHSQGYIHCMPKGKVSFVIKLSPLHPGYVRTECASTTTAHIAASSQFREENMVPICIYVCVCVEARI